MIAQVTTTREPRPAGGGAPDTGDTGEFRRRLLAGLAASIAEDGYRNTTVAGIVRRARTSRRTFYQHFADKQECFVALHTESHAALIRRIYAAVDQAAPWERQVRQAIGSWIDFAENEPAITLSWIRDVPYLGPRARALQRDTMDAFVTMIETLCDSAEWRATRAGPVPRPVAILLLGGLRELIATTVEDGGRIGDITETAVAATTALLGPAR